MFFKKKKKDTEPQLIIFITSEYHSVSWEFHCLYVWAVDESVINFPHTPPRPRPIPITLKKYFVVKITLRVLSKLSADGLPLPSGRLLSGPLL